MEINDQDLHHIKQTYNILKEVHDENLTKSCDPYVFLVIIWSDDFEVNHTRKTVTLHGSKQLLLSRHQRCQHPKNILMPYV